MAPKRLSDDEKKEIVDLYRQPEETTSTLANRYGVSSSTISRILKLNLTAEEYDALVQQKRTSSGKPLTINS
ncbi:MAG: helix-turn-helix domain-containing protein, partial [Elainellaceae cyanobacterium]